MASFSCDGSICLDEDDESGDDQRDLQDSDHNSYCEIIVRPAPPGDLNNGLAVSYVEEEKDGQSSSGGEDENDSQGFEPLTMYLS